ncbi:hypothetical protein P4S63_05320 [Pseudoalteromonas sp. B193]
MQLWCLYVGMACVLVLFGWQLRLLKHLIFVSKKVSKHVEFSATFKRLFKNTHYRFGVIAQFFNVVAQTCVWTFTIQYVMEALDTNEVTGKYFTIQYDHLFSFSICNDLAYGIYSSCQTVNGNSIIAMLLCFYMVKMPNISGVWALVSISACLSLMFPTIYAISPTWVRR